jgi:hypothetical protein
MNSLVNLVIGIDPDVDKSGVACINTKTKEFELKTLSFFELFEYLEHHKVFIKEVRVEASWLIKKTNWHQNKMGTGVASRIGSNTGANHEVGRKIVEMCIYKNIPFVQVKPLKKHWKGTDGKITHGEIEKMVSNFPKRSNQEQRDALLLIL